MRAILSLVILCGLLFGFTIPIGGQETMQRFYLVPVIWVDNARGPGYFCWARPGHDPLPGCIDCRWAMMDYGFTDNALILAKDITQQDHDALILNTDVFSFPDNLDGPVDQDIQAFFEGIHLPTDWLTPATTWRELLRQVAGMMVFNQRYGGIAAAETGEIHSIFDTATLDTRLREMTAQEQSWFLSAVASFGYDPELVPMNARLRQLIKSTGDYWAGRPFYLGGMEF